MVGTEKKKLCNLVFLSLKQSKKQIDEAISKVVNVMKILHFYENFRFMKKLLPNWGNFFAPTSGVMFSTDLHYSVCSTQKDFRLSVQCL